MAPLIGFGPMTTRLTVERSTAELQGNKNDSVLLNTKVTNCNPSSLFDPNLVLNITILVLFSKVGLEPTFQGGFTTHPH